MKMAYDQRIWQQHMDAAVIALTWRDKMARNERRTGTSGQEGALERERQLWEAKAVRHLRRLARLAEQAPDPVTALQRVEELRRWSGLPRQELPDGLARRTPILVGAAAGAEA